MRKPYDFDILSALFSKIIRRTHMYLALFLTPWVLMCALSMMAMSHPELFHQRYGVTVVLYEKEKEVPYAAGFPLESRPQEIGSWLLSPSVTESIRSCAAGH